MRAARGLSGPILAGTSRRLAPGVREAMPLPGHVCRSRRRTSRPVPCVHFDRLVEVASAVNERNGEKMNKGFNARLYAGLSAAALMGVTMGAVVAAGPAMAKPYNCTEGKSGVSTYWAACKAGSGSYRAVARCARETSIGITIRDSFGPWRKTNTSVISVAACVSPTYVVGGSIGYSA